MLVLCLSAFYAGLFVTVGIAGLHLGRLVESLVCLSSQHIAAVVLIRRRLAPDSHCGC